MSRAAAINAKCKDCIYDPLSGGGTWRRQVEDCTVKSCALWPYRPKSIATVRNDANSGQSQTELGGAATQAPPSVGSAASHSSDCADEAGTW